VFHHGTLEIFALPPAATSMVNLPPMFKLVKLVDVETDLPKPS
jgi:hypothetical protein